MSNWTNRQTKATGRNNHLNPDTATSQHVRGRGNTRRNKAMKRNAVADEDSDDKENTDGEKAEKTEDKAQNNPLLELYKGRS